MAHDNVGRWLLARLRRDTVADGSAPSPSRSALDVGAGGDLGP